MGGQVRLRTGSLWPAILGHVTHNGATFLLSQVKAADSWEPKAAPWLLILALGGAGLACLALLWSGLVRGWISALSTSP